MEIFRHITRIGGNKDFVLSTTVLSCTDDSTKPIGNDYCAAKIVTKLDLVKHMPWYKEPIPHMNFINIVFPDGGKQSLKGNIITYKDVLDCIDGYKSAEIRGYNFAGLKHIIGHDWIVYTI